MPSPSPPATRPLRPLRSKPGTQPASAPSIPQDYPFNFGSNENQATWPAPFPSAGAKRRHAVISMLDSPTSSASPLNHSSTGRRRTRSTNMEVEEEERPLPFFTPSSPTRSVSRLLQ
ncbi:hypothetical protein CYLTODRAFT_80941 [Cylindrobasidium torrendii FP15055 ss-10]|uniref:Uncharacterized protein n=1 Tax=Cylindrobasidium torrendii FP15055 ss-10 TaxID=1314674 RepID=A0A0D7B308_9AGAR|nr:hypothetical protein CYLTODRAFT_80941 [Cylindrobasidium torrendii FP15055 ss-10]